MASEIYHFVLVAGILTSTPSPFPVSWGLPNSVVNSVKTKYFDSELLRLAFAMTAQSVFKHFLTEGDRFLVSKFSPLKDQGGYAIATNYG